MLRLGDPRCSLDIFPIDSTRLKGCKLPVPKGLLRLAQRFNVGWSVSYCLSPEGTAELPRVLRQLLRPALGARMEFPVHCTQPPTRHVGVNFGRRDAGTTQQFLNHPQVGAVLQQVRRKAVPQHVGRDVA